MTPLVPVLCLFAATAVLSLTAWLKWSRARLWVAAGLGLLAVLEPLTSSAAYARIVHSVDTRVEAGEFLLTLPAGSDFATYGPSEVSRSTIPRWQPTFYAKHAQQTWAAALTVLKERDIRYFLTHHSALDVFSPTTPELELALRQSATLIREFSPYKAGVTAHPVYDRIDPYYLPIGGFRGMRRPGPLVRLYHLD